MSLETTLARDEARHWEAKWKDHRRDCPDCAHRKERCEAGEVIFRGKQAADAELVLNRKLDRQPVPEQVALFDG